MPWHTLCCAFFACLLPSLKRWHGLCYVDIANKGTHKQQKQKSKNMKSLSIISGTLRKQDLIPAFLDTVREYAPDEYTQLMVCPFGPIPSYVDDEGDFSDWWESEDASFLLDELFDILNSCAPEGFYFGAHEGDGSDFGFWKQ